MADSDERLDGFMDYAYAGGKFLLALPLILIACAVRLIALPFAVVGWITHRMGFRF